MIGLKELKPDEIPQITLSKDRTTIYLLSTARKILGDPTHVRLFVDTVGDTVVIAIQPSSNGYKVQKGGGINVGRKLKKLKIKGRSTNYLLIEVPNIGRLHAFFFGEIPEEYKKYAVEPQESETSETTTPVKVEAKPTPEVPEPQTTPEVPEEEIEIGTPENDYEVEI